MHLRTVFLILIFVFCSVFLIVNWPSVMAPVSVNLLFDEIQAPLGLILLLGPGLLILICLLYGFVQQAGLAMEIRRTTKQLQEVRELADRAERSRFVELQKELDRQMKELREENNARHASLVSKLSAFEEELQNTSRVTIDSISASVGEVEDRLTQLVDWAGTKSVTIAEKNATAVAEEKP